MSKFNLISSIVQGISGIVLIVVAFIYYFKAVTVNFVIFLGVGVFFIGLSAYNVYKYVKWVKTHRDDGKDD